MSLSPIRALTLEVPESIDLRQAARYLGAPGEPDSGTLALLARCAPPLLHAAMPKAVWRTADTAAWDEAGILQGADIRRHLTECPQAILLAVTLGPMVDSQIRRSAVGDVAAGAAAITSSGAPTATIRSPAVAIASSRAVSMPSWAVKTFLERIIRTICCMGIPITGRK